LSASRLRELLLYHPSGLDDSGGEPLPTHVRTPSGAEVELRGSALREGISGRLGSAVELMGLRQGIFDHGTVSVISVATMAGVARAAEVVDDRRRWRANIVLETLDTEPFREDAWIGGTLVFGEGDAAAAVSVTSPDVRCMMINLDPDTAEQDPRLLKAVVRLNDNNAGVYGTVVRTGTIHVGQTVRLVAR